MQLLGKGYLSKNNYDTVTSFECGENNFVKKEHSNKSWKIWKEICFQMFQKPSSPVNGRETFIKFNKTV